MMRSAFLFLLVLSAHICVAQYNSVYTIDLNEFAFRTGHNASQWLVGENDPYVEGSPFLDKTWAKGLLTLQTDTTLRDLEYRYNIFAKQMQLRTLSDTLIVMYPEKIKHIVFGNMTFVYESYLKGEFGGKDYFQLITDGKCRFLLRREVDFIPKNPPMTPISGGYEYDRFSLHESVYLKKPGSLALYIKPGKKSVLNYLEDHRPELEQFVKANNTRFSDNASLAKLIDYYNSLK